MVKAVQAKLDSLDAVTEDCKRANNMNKSSSRDNFVRSTVSERLANNISPLDKVLSELHIFAIELLHIATKDLQLNLLRRIVLLERNREALKERLVHYLCADKAAIITTLTLGISSSEDIEADSRKDLLTSLLDMVGLTLHDRLQAHDLSSVKINFVQDKDSATTHRS